MTTNALAPLVSVIIPTFNGERYLEETLSSIFNQTFTNFEVIVVDDGSTDQTREILARHAERLQLVYPARGGSAAYARNIGLAHAKGKYIALIDQDDTWEKTKLERQIAFMEANPEIGMTHTNLRYIKDGRVVLDDYFKTCDSRQIDGGIVELFSFNFIKMPTPVILRALIVQVGGFDEALKGTDDYYLWMRIAALTRIVAIPEILATYRLHENNTSGDALKMESLTYLALSKILLANPDEFRGAPSKVIAMRMENLASTIAYIFKERKARLASLRWCLKAISHRPMKIDNYLKLIKYSLFAF